jgi:hypothetical protein
MTTNAIAPDAAAAEHAGPNLTAYDAAHMAMPISNEWLVAGIARTDRGDRARVAAIRFSGYAGELRNHHHDEDHVTFRRVTFRKLAQRVPDSADRSIAHERHRRAPPRRRAGRIPHAVPPHSRP